MPLGAGPRSQSSSSDGSVRSRSEVRSWSNNHETGTRGVALDYWREPAVSVFRSSLRTDTERGLRRRIVHRREGPTKNETYSKINS